jgi:hippurate hydrolase
MRKLVLATALAGTALAQAPDRAWLDAQLPELVAIYEDFHRHPELSFAERKTAAKLAELLGAAGLEVTANVGGTGVVALLRNGAGPVGLLRADMDALPIAEETGAPYASTVRAEAAGGQAIGVMHACGHDVHMTSLLGAARWFAAHRDSWSGTLVFIGQPAEERAGGARAMVAAGLFERFPKPEWALALHCDPNVPAGSVGVRSGPLMAAVDSVDVTLFGRGGHGARPHLTVDPVVLGAQFVMAVQTIVSREIDPVQPAVITVGAFQAGSKHNIIADRCELQLTVRSYDPAVRDQLKAAIVRKAEGLAAAAGAPQPKVVFSEPTGPLFNDVAVTETARRALVAALGKGSVVEAEQQMIAEDFGYFRDQGVPLCMFRLGTTSRDRLVLATESHTMPGQLHTSRYLPEARPSLEGGVTGLVAATRALLGRR